MRQLQLDTSILTQLTLLARENISPLRNTDQKMAVWKKKNFFMFFKSHKGRKKKMKRSCENGEKNSKLLGGYCNNSENSDDSSNAPSVE